VTSISFGGGTPGEFPAAGIARVIEALRGAAGAVDDGIEVSLEANPGSTSLGELSALAGAGVNRISFGAQSFDAGELKFLDRIHSPEAIGASLRAARSAGIGSVGLDLIFGLPGQNVDAWRTNLARAIELEPDHFSCYALTVEEGTPLALRVERGDVAAPDADVGADMYEAAERDLAAAGFEHYEISNWSRPGHESRHNRVYWTGGDYLGIGAGAHGFLDGERYENIAHPRAYIKKFVGCAGQTEGWPAVADRYRPDGATACGDFVEARLRLVEGFDSREIDERFPSVAPVVDQVLTECRGLGLIEAATATETGIRLTARGRLLHSEVCSRLIARLSRGTR
jgi:oxygen-independent coproporphyrinogen-3 oxidase